MYNADKNAPPVNPLPTVVIILAVTMGAVEALFQLGEAGIIGGPGAAAWRLLIASQYGFSNGAVFWMWETGQYPATVLIRFVSYNFVHTGFVATLFNMMFVLTLGKFVGERVPALAFLVIFFGSSALAALIQAVVMGPSHSMLGAGAASYGLIGAFSWILFSEQRAAGENGLRAFQLIGALAVLMLIFFVMFGQSDWFERLSGFGIGFLLCVLLRPVPGQGISYWRIWMRGRSNY